jgi:hypothetical protein
MAILPERLRLRTRSLGMRHCGAMCEAMYSALLGGTKPALATATTWQRPGKPSRRVSLHSWRSAWRQWFDGIRARQ